MKVKEREVVLRGLPISQGVAIGSLTYFTHTPNVIPDRPIPPDAIENEIQRWRRALIHCKQDIKRLKKQLEIDNSEEAVAVLGAHIQIMDDPLLTTEMEERIRNLKKNAEYVFQAFINEYQRRFNQIEDLFFKERCKDLLDIARRILAHLMNSARFSLTELPENSIVYAQELAASEVAEARQSCVSAFISEQGGTTSHAAIVAKAKGIPYVANIDFEIVKSALNTTVIVDGRTGQVILFPTPETLSKYEKIRTRLANIFQALEKTSTLRSETYDGYSVRLSANIEMINELDLLHKYGGYGVGLFRSEYIFLSKQKFPTEEEQYIIYRSMTERMKGLPITIRTFDVGGDKLTIEQQNAMQGNPYLGCRALRFLLKERDIFRAQLKAILRASEHGQVSVMFPMVSGLPELLETKKIIQEAKDELAEEGKFTGNILRIGCMVEVPSAAMIADILAKECDFLSIGTNDLIQYSLAVDRQNPVINMLHTPMHPGLIRLIKLIVDLAKRHNVPVSICGEIAADPRFTPLLLGLGVRELSVALRHLPWIKKVIRSTSIVDAYAMTQEALKLSTSTDVQKLLTSFLLSNLPEEFLEHSPFDFLQENGLSPAEAWEG